LYNAFNLHGFTEQIPNKLLMHYLIILQLKKQELNYWIKMENKTDLEDLRKLIGV